MLYPRIGTINNREVLVDDSQMTGYKEHMTQEHRTLFLSGVITGEMDSQNLLLALDTISHEPIKIIITSAGGDLDSTFLFYDTFKLVKSPIITIGRFCASAAAILMAAGEKRYLYEHSKMLLHLPSGQMGGDAKDWEIQHKQMQKYKDKSVDILIECGAKKDRESILKDMDRDFWLEPQEAIEYGLADEIITTKDWQKLIKG